MAELWFTSLDGTLRLPGYAIGPYGAWGDLQWSFRWGEGACGMYEAQWNMPLPPDFEHPLLRRGTLVEITDGPWRMGSWLTLAEPAKGTGLSDPWQFVANGVGREVEGDHSWFCDDGAGNTTTVASTSIDVAIANGLRWSGRDATVPAVSFGGTTTTDDLQSIGSLLNAYGDASNQRWRVGQDNIVGYKADPTTPTYQITPNTVALGTADDDYATVVKLRYINSATSLNATATATAGNTQTKFGRREYAQSIIGLGPLSSATAATYAAGILAKAKGRLAWTNGLTVTSNEILTMGGVPADLSKVAEDVGEGCMVRLQGISSDLLEYNGQTYLDIIIGDAKYVDDAPTIGLSPLGLAARDLASIVESVTGYKDAA